ncbi:MAG TPA: prolyl oligopeptidase family serine peptidase [Thermoanaerobaculia bacterium]|nr:prolyl oligopeptidase family serine peptidase [Thermoanaerobaculia bacterium]
MSRTQRPRFRTLVILSAALAIAASSAAQSPPASPPAPPAAAIRAVTDDYFGRKVVDPYRWMENTGDPDFVAWMKAQNDYTRSVLDRIPGREALAGRIRELDNAGVTVSSAVRLGERYFYLKAEPGSDNRKLCVRDGLSGAERVLLDPEKRSTKDTHYSIDYFVPALDASRVAVGVSAGGSENSVLEILETASGNSLPERIERTQFGVVDWSLDGKSFHYNQLAKLSAGSAPTDRYLKSMVRRHVLGTPVEKDPVVFGFGVSAKVPMTPEDLPFLFSSPASPWIAGVIAHGVQNERTVYVARRSSLAGGATPWRKIADVDDAVTSLDLRGDTAYLLTHKNASRFKIMTVDCAHPEKKPAELVPESDAVITSLGVARDALYVQDLNGGLGRLRRVPASGGKIQTVALPFEGAISASVTDSRQDGALVQMTSWTKSPLWYAYDPKAAAMTDTKLEPPSPVDFSAIASVEVKAKSADGTMVPLSIVYNKNIVLDGSHPVWLTGYGAYGITIDPGFSPTRLAWLERGGVFAFAHVRGGGEYGEDWHRAGMLKTKQHTIDDFLACAEYLVEKKYTSAAHLSGEGTSAGGITIGGAITQRPELFSAALIRVGDSDALRSETMEAGPANIPEFGTVKTEEGFQALYAMDAYQHVKDSAAYPAVMLTTGANDPRVAPWQAGKMAARLQAATSSGKPVLLRVDYDAGHGFGSTKSQRDTEMADEEAFLFWQLGVAEFQPK